MTEGGLLGFAAPGSRGAVEIVYTKDYTQKVRPFVFDWDDANMDHIARHGFTPEEVEEVFGGPYQVRRSRQGRYVALGETFDGRLAYVVYERLVRDVVRVVTARDMNDWERRLYRRK